MQAMALCEGFYQRLLHVQVGSVVRPLIVLGCGLMMLNAWAEVEKRAQEKLLAEDEYRTEIEEVVVVAKPPEWRELKSEQQWRPDRFELPESKSQPRLQWLPEYDEDERDQYQGVRDRLDEKPAFKIFDWRF